MDNFIGIGWTSFYRDIFNLLEPAQEIIVYPTELASLATR